MTSFQISNLGKALYSLMSGSVSVYPTVAPQNTSGTYVTYETLRVDCDDVKQDYSWADHATVLIMIHADTRALAQAAGITVRGLLDQYSGTSGGVAIDSAYYVTEGTEWDEDLKKYILIQEYVIRVLNT